MNKMWKKTAAIAMSAVLAAAGANGIAFKAKAAEPETDSVVNKTSVSGIMQYLGSYSTGATNEDGGVAEIVKYNKENQKMYLVSGQFQSVDIVSLANVVSGQENQYTLEKRIDVAKLAAEHGFTAGDITSVDVNTQKDCIAIAVQGTEYTDNGSIVVLDYDGEYITHYEAGCQPDMITFSKDGKYILSANEGEPREGYAEGTTDPKGSVTVVEIGNTAATGEAVTLDFTAFDEKREELIADQVLLKKETLPSVDLEPEYININEESSRAYISLQENNAVATLNLQTMTIEAVKGLGMKDYSVEGSGLDYNKDGKIDIATADALGVFMPDGLACVSLGGVEYIVTPNEGDAREWGSGDNEYTNIGSAKLFGAEKKIEYLLNDSMDGLEEDKTYLFGGRSFSIFRADTMELVFDSGDDFERIIGQYYPEIFNSNHKELEADGRSNKKGPEPEDVKVMTIGNHTYAFVGLERAGGVMMYDITNPAESTFVDYLNVRNMTDGTIDNGSDLGAEGLCTIEAKDSPTGKTMLLAANEVSGTVTVMEIVPDTTITVYHTNDMHGTVENLSYVADLKKKTDNALLIDAGDALQGSALATYTNGSAIMELMNLAGYDGATLGNHEFDYGTTIALENAKAAQFPVVSANVRTASGEALLAGVNDNNGEYFICEAGGKRIGFFGLTTIEAAYKCNPAKLEGVTFEDETAYAKKMVEALEAEAVDAIIAIAHVGIDSATLNTSHRIAEDVEGIDVIIDGHSHSEDDTVIKDTLITQTGTKLANLGKLELTWNYNGELEEVDAELLDKETYQSMAEKDAVVDEKYTQLNNELKPILDEKVADFTNSCFAFADGNRVSRIEETPAGNLVADAMRWNGSSMLETLGYDYPVVALQNGGGVRADLEAGDVTVGDILNVLPFGNMLAISRITPAVLYQALENGVCHIGYNEEGTLDLSTCDGRFPQISGMRIEIDLSKTAYDPEHPEAGTGERIQAVYLLNDNGTETLLDRQDTKTQIALVSNDFEMAGGDGYIMLGNLPIICQGGLLDAALNSYIKAHLTNNTFTYAKTEGRILYTALNNGKVDITLDIPVRPASLSTVLVDGVTAEAVTIEEATDEAVKSGYLVLKHADAGMHTVTIDGTDYYISTFTMQHVKSVQSSETEKEIVPGDVDGNGKVELEDAQMALKAALKIIQLNAVQKQAADVNHNGTVTLEDAQMILKAALKIESLS